ncbi:NAD(P)H-binding protein [Nocardia asiatica]|uniref:NAD(P)H-binding protein n=2 Tax=Nocardia asiatica TaxID=209252 RepID=UPI001FE08AAD|nr:NAD(P)H-binding protein [Nocardia asiatica]
MIEHFARRAVTVECVTPSRRGGLLCLQTYSHIRSLLQGTSLLSESFPSYAAGMVTVIFGASGNVGRHVAAGLTAKGERVRLTSRNPDTGLFPPGADVVAADLERPETLPAALEGAQRVFLYAKPDGIDGFVAAAESAGVRHVVLLSSGAVLLPGAEHNPIARLHTAVESALEKSALSWTFIRPGMFATNALWWWQQSIRDRAVARLPYPEARTAPIHEKDMAAVAVTALTEPGHHGHAYTVLGPEALTLREQVGRIGEAIGREISIEVVSVEQARVELSKTVPPIGIEAILAGWHAGTIAPPPVSKLVEEITGRPARTFAQWAKDHAADFR